MLFTTLTLYQQKHHQQMKPSALIPPEPLAQTNLFFFPQSNLPQVFSHSNEELTNTVTLTIVEPPGRFIKTNISGLYPQNL